MFVNPYSWYKYFFVPSAFTAKEETEQFINKGKSLVLEQVDVIGEKAKSGFDYLKTILILVAVIMVANLFRK